MDRDNILEHMKKVQYGSSIYSDNVHKYNKLDSVRNNVNVTHVNIYI